MQFVEKFPVFVGDLFVSKKISRVKSIGNNAARFVWRFSTSREFEEPFGYCLFFQIMKFFSIFRGLVIRQVGFNNCAGNFQC